MTATYYIPPVHLKPLENSNHCLISSYVKNYILNKIKIKAKYQSSPHSVKWIQNTHDLMYFYMCIVNDKAKSIANLGVLVAMY